VPHRCLLSLLVLALPPSAAATEWGVVVRSAFRQSSGSESGLSPIVYSGASLVDQSIELTVYPHAALALEADASRHVPLLRLDGGVAPAAEIWQAGVGMGARAGVGPLIAKAHIAYALAQLPSVVRGPGTPSLLHGPRFALGLVAPLPAGFELFSRGTLLLPFLSLDGRGERGDGEALEMRIGIEKRIASMAGKHVGLRLDFRRSIESLRGASGSLISQFVANSIGLSVTLARIPEDAS
jgi:hypothetical protein